MAVAGDRPRQRISRPGSSRISPDARDPLYIGQTAKVYVDGTPSSLGLILKSGPGAVTGLTYSPGYQTGPGVLTLSQNSVANAHVDISIPLLQLGAASSCVHGKKVFAYTGSDQTFPLPKNCSYVKVKMWGGGGTVGTNWPSNPTTRFPGGGGGFVSATLVSAETRLLGDLTVIVGSGGGHVAVGAGVYGGGGDGGPWGVNNGAGRSAIRIGATEVLTAGGGGGAVNQGPIHNVGSNDNCMVARFGAGGAGGGLVAQDAYGGDTNGGGGTQSEGGASQAGAGSKFKGGASYWAGASGGGGYYGGGAGGYNAVCGPGNYGGGGGGSSYLGGGGFSVMNAVTIAGQNENAGAMDDVDYQAGIGMGGTVVPQQTYTDGGNGLVILEW